MSFEETEKTFWDFFQNKRKHNETLVQAFMSSEEII